MEPKKKSDIEEFGGEVNDKSEFNWRSYKHKRDAINE